MTTNQGTGGQDHHRTKSHFTFGNDEWKGTATYKSDYSCAKVFPTSRTKKNVPQPCAEVIPPVSKALERGKWSSSTMRDFTGFGEISRKTVYEAGKAAFKSNKALQSTELGLLQENVRIPMTTMYNIDYNTNMFGVQMPKCARVRQELFKTSRKPSSARTDSFVTEAQHAFQWPSSDRLRLPLHVRAPST